MYKRCEREEGVVENSKVSRGGKGGLSDFKAKAAAAVGVGGTGVPMCREQDGKWDCSGCRNDFKAEAVAAVGRVLRSVAAAAAAPAAR
eukprot:174601-Pelagomonas_calceolata.AAC.1